MPAFDAPAASPAPVPRATRIAFGLGAVAYGIKDNGFSVFLLLYYNQIIGLDAGMVGLTLLIALLLDAVIDPMVGHWSDRTRTRWGRRHPWLYISALPIALFWIALWFPPAISQSMQYVWLLAFATLLRMSVSLNEVPSIALAPEMTVDYHERTAILGLRYFFGWAGGLLMLAAAYGIFRLGDANFATAASFRAYAVAGAVVMLVTVLVSALGTHRHYAKPVAADMHQPTLRDTLACFRYRPFLILAVAALCAFASQGITFSLSTYLLGYVWRFGWQEQLTYAGILFFGVLLGLVLARRLGYHYGKRGAAVRLTVATMTIGALPYLLFLVGALPPSGTVPTTIIFMGLVMVSTGTGIGGMITASSMMADVATAHQAISGKAQEGVFFSGWFFMQKCVTGLGIFMAGQILTLIGFPRLANPATVDPDIVALLAANYMVIIIMLGIATAWALSRFPLEAGPALRPAVPAYQG